MPLYTTGLPARRRVIDLSIVSRDFRYVTTIRQGGCYITRSKPGVICIKFCGMDRKCHAALTRRGFQPVDCTCSRRFWAFFLRIGAGKRPTESASMRAAFSAWPRRRPLQLPCALEHDNHQIIRIRNGRKRADILNRAICDRDSSRNTGTQPDRIATVGKCTGARRNPCGYSEPDRFISWDHSCCQYQAQATRKNQESLIHTLLSARFRISLGETLIYSSTKSHYGFLFPRCKTCR